MAALSRHCRDARKNMKINPTITPTITMTSVRGARKLLVRWHESGRIRRKYFARQNQADSYVAMLKKQSVTSAARLQLLPQTSQEELLFLHNEATARGVKLSKLLLLLVSEQGKPTTTAPKLSVVLAEMDAAKRKAGDNPYYVDTLRQIIKRFAKAQESGQDDLPIDKYTVRHLETFLNANKLASRKTLRSKLSTFFKYAILRDYRVDNPCSKLLKIRRTDPPPKVFTLKEVTTCVKWLEKHPRALAWFVLSSFCGLRPEEAQHATWKMINFDEGWIRVEAQTTKVRQRRVVRPLPEAMAWLKYAQKMNSELPLTRKQLQLERNPLRAELGWKQWDKDVTRHTASSMWFAATEDAASVAKSLGHTEAVMRKNYMAPVTPKEAEKFWALRPPAVKNPYVKPTKKKKKSNSTPNKPSTSASTSSMASSKSSSPATPTSTSSTCNSTTPTPTTPTPPSTGC